MIGEMTLTGDCVVGCGKSRQSVHIPEEYGLVKSSRGYLFLISRVG